MTDPFVAEVRMFGFDFAPPGWAFCSGQLLPLSQNLALFALLGTVYGGNGKSTFALPDFMGMAVMHAGETSGTWPGTVAGSETVTLLESEIPSHSHRYTVSAESASAKSPANLLPAKGAGVAMYAPSGGPQTTMSDAALGVTGGDLPHNNMQPYLTVNYCIALQGTFPQRA